MPPAFLLHTMDLPFEPGRHTCPACAAPPATTVGPRYAGRAGMLWGRRTFDEQLFRCAEGHVYSVRIERGRGGEAVSTAAWDSIDDWLRARTGAEALERPPGL